MTFFSFIFFGLKKVFKCFTAVLSMFDFRVFIFLCGFALLSEFGVDGARIKDKTLTMAKLNRELRKEHKDFFSYHVLSMLIITAYGDHLYNITDETISPECLKTVKATITMEMQLTIGKEMGSLLVTAIEDSMDEFGKDKGSTKHPLEFVCPRLEKAFAVKPTLNRSYENAQKNLMKGFTGGGRPPYSKELFVRKSAIGLFMMKKLKVPDIARYICNEEVQNQVEEGDAYSTRTHLFVKSIIAVAEKEQFAESIQRMYEQSLDEIVSQITPNVSIDTLLLPDEKTFWFLPEVLKIFYKNLSKDAVLKKEIEDAAAVIGKNADKEDLDFSKI